MNKKILHDDNAFFKSYDRGFFLSGALAISTIVAIAAYINSYNVVALVAGTGSLTSAFGLYRLLK